MHGKRGFAGFAIPNSIAFPPLQLSAGTDKCRNLVYCSSKPDKAPAVPVSGMAAEPDTEQDAAEAMPIAHGIYPDLPYEPTNEDLAAMQKTEFIGAGK